MGKVTQLEPYVGWDELCAHFDMSKRFFEKLLRFGLPSAMIGNRRRFRLSQVERWLEANGYLTQEGDAA